MKPQPRWLAICSFAMIALSSYPVLADVVGPGPDTCPNGSVPSSCHGGPYCYPLTCTGDADCDEGEKCQSAEVCTTTIECAGGWGGSSPTSNVLGPCGDGCSAGTCTPLKVCQKTSSTGAGGEGGSGGSGGGGDDLIVKGCACSLEKGSTLGGVAGAVALLAGLSAFTGRRRSRGRKR